MLDFVNFSIVALDSEGCGALEKCGMDERLRLSNSENVQCGKKGFRYISHDEGWLIAWRRNG